MNAWKYIIKITLILFLAAGSFFDIKCKSIPVWYLAAGFATGIFLKIISGSFDILQIAGGFLIGILLLVLSVLTKGKIGKGDACMFVITGVFTGFAENVILLFVSLLEAALAAAVLIFTKKAEKKSLIAFVPFMLAGYDVLLLLGF